MSLMDVLENERLAYLSTGNNSMVDEFDSAIKELKLLQKPKSCTGCQYESFGTKGSNICFRCSRFFDDKYTENED